MICLLARFLVWYRRWSAEQDARLHGSHDPFLDFPAQPTAAARGTGAGGPADPRPTL